MSQLRRAAFPWYDYHCLCGQEPRTGKEWKYAAKQMRESDLHGDDVLCDGAVDEHL